MGGTSAMERRKWRREEQRGGWEKGQSPFVLEHGYDCGRNQLVLFSQASSAVGYKIGNNYCIMVKLGLFAMISRVIMIFSTL